MMQSKRNNETIFPIHNETIQIHRKNIKFIIEGKKKTKKLIKVNITYKQILDIETYSSTNSDLKLDAVQ
jgi:hypothetical protein